MKLFFSTLEKKCNQGFVQESEIDVSKKDLVTCWKLIIKEM